MFYKFIFTCMFIISSSATAIELEDINTFEAKFTQTIINSSDKKIIYKGKIYIKDQTKIVWKYENPIVKNVYIDKDFAIIDEPELEQAIFTSLKNEINIVTLIKEAKKVEPNIYLTSIYDTEYTIQTEDKRMKSVKYNDELENRITIEFSDILQNHKIDESSFKFNPPVGYDIIRK